MEPTPGGFEAFRPLPYIHAALAMAQVIITVLLIGLAPADAEPDWMVLGVLYGMVPVEAGFALAVAPIVFRKTLASSAYIIRWAMLTAACIFGAVASMLGGPAALAGLCWLVAAVGMVLTRPTRDAFTAWEMRRLEA